MGTPYYYFSASLPALDFESEAPLSTQDFLENCGCLMEGRDASLVDQFLSEDGSEVKTNNDVVKELFDFNRNFRNAIAWFRAERAGKDPLDSIRGIDQYRDPFITETITQASKEEDLLSAEKLLDYARWKALDDLIIGHYNDTEFLLSYGLKLKILERYKSINSSKGEEILRELKLMEIPEEAA